MKSVPLIVSVAILKHGREVEGAPMVELARRCRLSRPRAQKLVRQWGMGKIRIERRGGHKRTSFKPRPDGRRAHSNDDRRAAALGDANRRAELARSYWAPASGGRTTP